MRRAALPLLFPKRNKAYNTSFDGTILTGSQTTPLPGFSIGMSTTGLTLNVLGKFIVDGIPVMRVQISGTATGTAQVSIGTTTTGVGIETIPPANPGQVWTTSAYFALVAGTIPVAAILTCQGASLANGFVEQGSVNIAGMDATLRRFQVPRQLAGATVAKVRWGITLGNFTAAVVYDMTIDFGGIQVEKKPFASPLEFT